MKNVFCGETASLSVLITFVVVSSRKSPRRDCADTCVCSGSTRAYASEARPSSHSRNGDGSRCAVFIKSHHQLQASDNRSATSRDRVKAVEVEYNAFGIAKE